MQDGISNSSKETSSSIQEHYLKEPSLSFTLEKKNLDTYKLSSEVSAKPIEIKDYSIFTAELVKTLYNNIENNVLKNSDSSTEVKPIDYNKLLQQILSNKKEANDLINIELNKALEKYREILFDIEEATRTLTDREIDDNKILKEIFDEKKKILSNSALCHLKKKNYKEAIEIDRYILGIDRNFEKSYLRLISCFTNLGNLDDANYYANLMKSIFGGGIVNKYSEYFNELEAKNNQADENLKKLSKRSTLKKRESEIISELGDESNIASKKQKGNEVEKRNNETSFLSKIIRFILGSGLVLVSSGVLFYLYKNKHKYMI